MFVLYAALETLIESFQALYHSKRTLNATKLRQTKIVRVHAPKNPDLKEARYNFSPASKLDSKHNWRLYLYQIILFDRKMYPTA